MKPNRHTYRERTAGRYLKTAAGVGRNSTSAHIRCTQCGDEGTVRMGTLMPPEIIDQKFRTAGWKLDPHVCLTCICKAKKDKPMALPTDTAIKAQAKLHRLLGEHFDIEAGAFTASWDDGKLSKETGLALDLVVATRVAAYGDLKAPDALVSLRADLQAMEQLLAEQHRANLASLVEMRAQLGKTLVRFAA
jgi:hypothetical protein